MNPLAAVQSNRWLSRLPAPILQELAGLAQVRRLANGEVFVSRGQQPEGLALVVTGALQSSAYSEDGREVGHSLTMPTRLWGVVAIMDGEGSVHDARAKGATELLVIPAQAFQDALERHPALLRAMALMLCYRMRKNYSAVEELGLATLRQRLARQLCTLAAGSGAPPPGAMVQLVVTQEELAVLVAGSRASVNRELSDMERNGMLQRQYGGITVTDLGQLQSLCVTQQFFEY